jgi:predicted ATP-grasp superfamily ATP-dependent carboligase
MNTRRRPPAAIVIGLDSITGLQTARLLARRDIGVVGIARSADHPSCRSNACERLVIAPADAALVDVLERLAPTFAEPPVLVPCTDLSVLALSRHREQLAARYRSVLPPPGVLEQLVDKAAFQSLAEREGLPVARTVVASSRADIERAAMTLRYPCVLKPAVKSHRWLTATAAKVFKAEDAGALLRHYDICRDWAEVLIAQEWVDGPDDAHVTCNAYFDAHGRAHLTFVSRKLRQWPLEGGVGCLSEECREDEVSAVTTRLFQRAGHRGLAYLEMKRDRRHGGYVIIEPNVGRPTGRSAAADAAGIDLIYAHYCDALGWPLPAPRPQAYGPTKWIYLRQDLQAAASLRRRGALTTADWLRSLRGVRHDAVFSWRDPKPFLADLAVGVRKAFGSQHQRAAPPTPPTDFDVHGIVGVRLIGASPRDVAAVSRQLGPPTARLAQEPDLVIRFVEHLPIDGLHWIEYPRTGFTADGFYVLASGKRPARVRVPLDRIGGQCEFVCQSGLRSVPLLMQGVVLTALAKGWTPLHASAFSYGGTGVLVTGWAKGGKTEALLAFAAAGAAYIGDEWILLSSDGRMFGIAEALRLQDWHLRQLPSLRRHAPLARRTAFRLVHAADALHRRLPDGPLGRLLGKHTLADALPALRRQLNVQVNPLEIFERRRGAGGVPLDRLFLMISWDDQRTVVDRGDGAGIAQRMAASVMYELQPLLSSYLAWRFAFPDRRNDLLERAAAILPAQLEHVLGGRDAHVVRHPYPCRLTSLFDAMAPGCQSPTPPAPSLLMLAPAPQSFGGYR